MVAVGASSLSEFSIPAAFFKAFLFDFGSRASPTVRFLAGCSFFAPREGRLPAVVSSVACFVLSFDFFPGAGCGSAEEEGSSLVSLPFFSSFLLSSLGVHFFH